MKRRICIALLAAGLASPAFAGDAPMARIVEVSGNVLVSNDQSMASVGEAFRLKPGMRVLVTLNSSATIEYGNGCRVRLAAGERFEVRDGAACSHRAMQPTALAPVIARMK